MPAVDVRLVDVVRRFGDTAAVDHLDLEVRDGEFVSAVALVVFTTLRQRRVAARDHTGARA